MYAPHHDPEVLLGAVLDASRRAGCDCSPDVELTEEFPGMFHAHVGHDDGCALLARRVARQVAPWN